MPHPKGSLISHFSRLVRSSGGINLAQGRPGFSPPQELLALLEQRALESDLHQYAPGNGNFLLLDALVRQHKPMLNEPLNSDHFLVVNGATEGVFLAFFYLAGTLKKRPVALSFDPVYESYPELAAMMQVPFLYSPLNDDLSVDFSELDKVMGQNGVNIIFMSSPGNPLGKVWLEEELVQLVGLAESHDAHIIFDAVYRDIYFRSPPCFPLPLSRERFIYVNSFSKTLSITGWRLGYMIASPEHMGRIRAIHDYSGLSAPSLLQSVLVEYLTANDYGSSYAHSVRERCSETHLILRDCLRANGCRVPDIDGGYFLWARLPAGFNNAFEFASTLYKEARIGVVPGKNFSKRQTDCIRLNFATETSIICEAAERISRFFSGFGK